jgi:hypothetical protein
MYAFRKGYIKLNAIIKCGNRDYCADGKEVPVQGAASVFPDNLKNALKKYEEGNNKIY